MSKDNLSEKHRRETESLDCSQQTQKSFWKTASPFPRLQHFRIFGVHAEDLPDDPCYRCGYFFLSSDWIFHLFGAVDPMAPACKLHDEAYEYGPGIGMTQEEADNLFYEAMTAIANQYSGIKRGALYAQRNLYYGIVRSIGWMYY